MADLVFNMASGSLTGTLCGEKIESYAVSGGRGGSKMKNAENYFLVNNPFGTRVKKDKNTIGGPLPLGKYTMTTKKEKDKIVENWVRLTHFMENAMHKRDGFAIHGRGIRGSDGCIVPLDFSVVQQIFSLVKKNEEERRISPILEVVAIGADPDYKHKLYQNLV